jgi:hypothetical protein
MMRRQEAYTRLIQPTQEEHEEEEQGEMEPSLEFLTAVLGLCAIKTSSATMLWNIDSIRLMPRRKERSSTDSPLPLCPTASVGAEHAVVGPKH